MQGHIDHSDGEGWKYETIEQRIQRLRYEVAPHGRTLEAHDLVILPDDPDPDEFGAEVAEAAAILQKRSDSLREEYSLYDDTVEALEDIRSENVEPEDDEDDEDEPATTGPERILVDGEDANHMVRLAMTPNWMKVGMMLGQMSMIVLLGYLILRLL